MKATAVKDFTASVNGRDYDCKAGDSLEADAKTVEQMEAIGLVTTKQIRGGKPRKAAQDD